MLLINFNSSRISVRGLHSGGIAYISLAKGAWVVCILTLLDFAETNAITKPYLSSWLWLIGDWGWIPAPDVNGCVQRWYSILGGICPESWKHSTPQTAEMDSNTGS